MVNGDVTIPQWWIDTYEDNVLHALQQKESRLEPYVRSVEIKGEKRRLNYTGTRKMKEIKGRWQDTELEESRFGVRWAFAKRYGDAFPMDETDIEHNFTDPTSDMTQAGIKSALRLKDELIIKSFYANAIAGHDADEIKPFPNTQRLDIQLGSPIGAKANTGLNVEKLKWARYYLTRAEIDPNDTLVVGCTAYQIKDMLDQLEVTNSDYSPVKALYEGRVDYFMGFKFIRTELMPWENEIRSCTAWATSCVGLGIRKGITVKSAEIAQKNFDRLTQIQMRGGAVRLYDRGVIDIPCMEPADVQDTNPDEF